MKESYEASKTEIEFITLPTKNKNFTGIKTGKLTVLGPVGRDIKTKQIIWLCKCDCGRNHTVKARDLRPSGTKSCGCATLEGLRAANTRHGMRKNRLYPIWMGIKQRCTNPNDKNYANYGERGIGIYKEWITDFSKFYDYVTSLPDYDRKGYSLDRIDNNRGYEPDNLKFSTAKEQLRNTRVNRLVTYKGEVKCLMEWAEELNLDYNLVTKRLENGWSIEDCFEKPKREIKPEKKSKHKGIYWHRHTQTWRAQLQTQNKRKTLSGFKTETEALIAYLCEKKKSNEQS